MPAEKSAAQPAAKAATKTNRGQNVDTRVRPQNDEKVKAKVRPDYALPTHSAPLGVAFADGRITDSRFASGAFVGMHGSWNRERPVEYKVVFVPFNQGRPGGNAVDFLTGVLIDGKTMGRPVGVTVTPRGEVIVADALANTLWRVAPVR